MECVRLPIKDSEKILYIGLGLFSKKEDLETFMNNYNLVDGRAFYNESLAKDYCMRANNAGLVAEFEKKGVE
ncbi:hypothetical protein LS74_010450 [Helicobacter magdeburgensis]|uniref:Uncharacterized protein n=1 Tax=Helicobacter magdeburgensis TaxID=471858 RepID=A0A4U8SXY5_9HELI|nr:MULTISPECIES: hypothetical protein [Helicobacter]TLD91077.1 hypothetical protein LS74_010450 [Helicobacter magdeburgensis]BDB65698.1 hypothetical protein T36_2177 [Helicobacter cinaedi]